MVEQRQNKDQVPNVTGIGGIVISNPTDFTTNVDGSAIGGGGNTMIVEDEGGVVAGGPHDTLDFVGPGVTASNAGGGTATITIPGGGGGGIQDAEFVRVATTPLGLIPPGPTALSFAPVVIGGDTPIAAAIELTTPGPIVGPTKFFIFTNPAGGSVTTTIDGTVTLPHYKHLIIPSAGPIITISTATGGIFTAWIYGYWTTT